MSWKQFIDTFEVVSHNGAYVEFFLFTSWNAKAVHKSARFYQTCTSSQCFSSRQLGIFSLIPKSHGKIFYWHVLYPWNHGIFTAIFAHVIEITSQLWMLRAFYTTYSHNYSMDKQITSTLNQIEMDLSRSIKKLYY